MDGPYRPPPGTPTPPRRPGDSGLGGDEAGMSPRQGLSPTRVLLSPPETPAGPGRPIGLDHRFEPHVTGCGQEHRPETAGPVGPARVPIAAGEQGMGEAGARMDFQAQLWQIDPGQQGKDLGTQGA
jgi:hypothetical protein